MVLWRVIRAVVGFPLLPDVVEPWQKFCPNPFPQVFEFVIFEKTSDSLIVQSIRVLALKSVVAHRLDKLFPLVLRQKSEFVEALRKADFGNDIEKQSRFRYAVEEIAMVLQVQRDELLERRRERKPCSPDLMPKPKATPTYTTCSARIRQASPASGETRAWARQQLSRCQRPRR